MSLVTRWSFVARTPVLSDVRRELERRTGASFALGEEATARVSRVSGEDAGLPWAHARLQAPGVDPGCAIELARRHGVVEAAGTRPHPYLWAQLDAALRELGGDRDSSLTTWLPLAARKRLDRPWSLLSWAERTRLRVRSIAMMQLW